MLITLGIIIGLVIINFILGFIFSVCKLQTRCDLWESQMIKEIKDETYIG